MMVENKEPTVCKRCIMDTTASDIQFDHNGICNFCTEYLEDCADTLNWDTEKKKKELDELVERIKKDGRGKKYDCIVGISGGVDSSWALVKAKELGLRPLAVHMDNGWNSELAQRNIENLVKKLDVDLYTYVIEWNEYRRLMQAFFDADVIDVELLYDNAMLAVNYQQASRRGIKYILSGSNQATEGMRVPQCWNWFKFDKKNIAGIANTGAVGIQTYPAIGTFKYIYYGFLRSIRWVSFLDLFQYNKMSVLDELERKYSYKRYPYKHYESIFTRFYQGYVLVKKFGVDKRKLHFSTLIASGQMTRDQALKDLNTIAYPSVTELDDDLDYFVKKMHWSPADLKKYLERPEIKHDCYPSEKKRWDSLKKIYFGFNSLIDSNKGRL